jgi:hypothetical protein
LVDNLRDRIVKLEEARAPDAKELKADISRLKDEVNMALEKLKAWTENKNLEHLQAINSRLDKILASVQEAPPRRNIRGVEGGGR